MKREGRANDSEILVARLIDRALRPLFPADYHAEVYVTVNLISADKDIQPDALAGLAASAALAVSDIPFGGPISEVRVARLDGEYVINPKFSEMDRVDLDIMVGGTIDNILMVEGEMKEVSEEVMLGAIKFAHEEIKKHCAVQIELSKELGKDVKRTYCHEVNDEELRQTIIRELYDKAYAIATSGTMKHEREDKFNALEAEFAARYSEEELAEKAMLIHKYFHDDVQKKAMRNMILDEGLRLDGRHLLDQIQPDSQKLRRQQLLDQSCGILARTKLAADLHRIGRGCRSMALVHPAVFDRDAPGAYRRGQRHVRHRLRLHLADRAGRQHRPSGTGQLHNGRTPPLDESGTLHGRTGFRAGADPDLHIPRRVDQFRGLRADRTGADLLEHFEQGDPAGEDLARRFPAGQPHSDHSGTHGAGVPFPRRVPLRSGAVRNQILRSGARADGIRRHLLHALLHRLDSRKRRKQEITAPPQTRSSDTRKPFVR